MNADTFLNLINTWQFNIIALLIVMVIFVQFYKLAVVGARKDGAVTVVLQSIGGISILVLAPFYPMQFASDPKIYLFLFIAIIFYALNDRIEATVRKHLDVSLYSILNQFSRVFLVLYGLFLLGEDLVPQKLIGGALILLGSIALFYRQGKIRLNRYVILSMLASFFIATAIIIDVDISTHFNLPFYIMITLIAPSVIIFIAERFSLRDIHEEFRSERMKYHLITGIAWGLLILFMIRALQLGEVIIVAPLIAVSVLLNVIVAYFFHNERSHLPRKIIISLVIILGIYLTVA